MPNYNRTSDADRMRMQLAGVGPWSLNAYALICPHTGSSVMNWPDNTICYPGHGSGFRLGDKRRAIEAFLRTDHGSFFGDATWDMRT